ncbi:hypothetical protein Tco_0700179 [Tanacetum coccineum]
MIPQAILMRSGRKTINAAKPKAVHNAVKASACWVWKPKNRVIDHVSKYNNASITLKRFDYIDAQGRFKSVMAWMDAQTQGRHEHDQEFDAEITTVGAEVDDIAAETYVYIRRSATKTKDKEERQRISRAEGLIQDLLQKIFMKAKRSRR